MAARQADGGGEAVLTGSAVSPGVFTIAFPTDAAFVRKKAEANRELVAGAVRGLTGRAVTRAFELNEQATPAGAATLDHDRLIERLRDEFGAEEVFDDEPDQEKR